MFTHVPHTHQLLLEVEPRPGRLERDDVVDNAQKVGGTAGDGLQPGAMPVPGPDGTYIQRQKKGTGQHRIKARQGTTGSTGGFSPLDLLIHGGHTRDSYQGSIPRIQSMCVSPVKSGIASHL